MYIILCNLLYLQSTRDLTTKRNEIMPYHTARIYQSVPYILEHAVDRRKWWINRWRRSKMLVSGKKWLAIACAIVLCSCAMLYHANPTTIRTSYDTIKVSQYNIYIYTYLSISLKLYNILHKLAMANICINGYAVVQDKLKTFPISNQKSQNEWIFRN